MIGQEQRSIYLKLTALANELQGGAEKSHSYVDAALREASPDSYHILTHLSNYLTTSAMTCKKLIEWSKSCLLDDIIYSGNLRFQAELIIKILGSTATAGFAITNTIQDLRHSKINLRLFGYTLNRLLTIISTFSSSENLCLSSVCEEEKVIISIGGIQNSTYHKIAESLSIRPNCDWGILQTNEFFLCYEIVSLYGGNLWSETCQKSGGKLHFSIPVGKSV